jgi:hypothetical protein
MKKLHGFVSAFINVLPFDIHEHRHTVNIQFVIFYKTVPFMIGPRTGTRLIAGQLGFTCQQGQGFFLFATAFRLDLRPALPPVQWVPG